MLLNDHGFSSAINVVLLKLLNEIRLASCMNLCMKKLVSKVLAHETSFPFPQKFYMHSPRSLNPGDFHASCEISGSNGSEYGGHRCLGPRF
jgi:hypothetical protein